MTLTTFSLAVNGIVYANPTLSESGYGSSSSTAGDRAIGSTYSYKENGVSYQTITGVVTSVNATKNVFVVEDQNSKTSTTVSTDSQTVATLSIGKTVTVKLQVGNPIALSVVVAG